MPKATSCSRWSRPGCRPACARGTRWRLGGDEFAVLVEGVDDIAELDDLCERVLRSLRARSSSTGTRSWWAGIGVAVADSDDDAAGLLRNADMAMYRAKALGKDRYFVYQPSLREENVRRLELVEALRRDVSSRLVVHYQPIVDLATGEVQGSRPWFAGSARTACSRRTSSSRPPRRAG